MQQNQPIQFDDLPLSPALLRAVEEMGYTSATPIQADAIPMILEGRDIIGRSATGTGKTAAFGLPLVEQAVACAPNRPQALILAPTRELAQQISQELTKYARFKPEVSVATLYGGGSMAEQLVKLRRANIVVGTPGRVMDHMRRNTLKLDALRIAVLDEADEMLNMGFYEDIETILSAAPDQRQTLLFSATMPKAILDLTQRFQRDPHLVATDGGKRSLEAIKQYYYHVPKMQKAQALNLLLQALGEEKAVVFCNTKRMVDELCEALQGWGFASVGLHGDMAQGARTQVMRDFKAGRLNALIATDVAARGIDVEDVAAVINYDIPLDNEYYIHRIGRTGRAGKQGASHTLACDPGQIRRIKELERYVGAPIQRAMLPTVQQIEATRRAALLDSLAPNAQAVERFGTLYDELIERGADPKDLVCQLLARQAGEARPIPVVNDIVPATRSPRPQAAAPVRSRGASTPAYLKASIGRSQQILPGYIVSALVRGAGIPASSIGKIDIFRDYTRIELAPEDARRVLQRMSVGRIQDSRVHFTLLEEPVLRRRPARPAAPARMV